VIWVCSEAQLRQCDDALESCDAGVGHARPVQDELTQRGAVTKAGDRGDALAVRQVQHLQRGDPLQPDDAHVRYRRARQLQHPQCAAACQRSHIVDMVVFSRSSCSSDGISSSPCNDALSKSRNFRTVLRRRHDKERESRALTGRSMCRRQSTREGAAAWMILSSAVMSLWPSA
jgi:hypothetical protein